MHLSFHQPAARNTDPVLHLDCAGTGRLRGDACLAWAKACGGLMGKQHTHPVVWEEWIAPPEWAHLSGLERMRKAIETDAPRAPIAALIDMKMTGAEEGSCHFDAWPGPQHVNPIGVVHGG